MVQPEFGEAPRRRIDERIHAELLDEASHLAFRERPFHEIDEVRADTTLGEEPLCLAGIRALLHAEDLNFQRL